MDDGVAGPESFGDGEGVEVDVSDGSGAVIVDAEDVGLLVARVVFVVAPEDHDLLLGDLDCGLGGEGDHGLSFGDVQDGVDFFPHTRFLIEAFLRRCRLTILWMISLLSPTPPNL
jgi:hypothetical protein